MKIQEINNLAKKYGLNIRLVNESDAKKIMELRTDLKLAKHLHTTEQNLERQKLYIREYKIREGNELEFYFAFLIKEFNDPIGFYRIYNIDYLNKSFSIGSWIFQQGILEKFAILADIICKQIGFEFLGLESCYFDVRRENKKVMKYHKLYSPIFIKEDEETNNLFCLKRIDFIENKDNVLNLII